MPLRRNGFSRGSKDNQHPDRMKAAMFDDERDLEDPVGCHLCGGWYIVGWNSSSPLSGVLPGKKFIGRCRQRSQRVGLIASISDQCCVSRQHQRGGLLLLRSFSFTIVAASGTTVNRTFSTQMGGYGSSRCFSGMARGLTRGEGVGLFGLRVCKKLLLQCTHTNRH